MAEGQRHQRAGDAVEAEKHYRRALLLEPANPAALALSGSLALTNGDAARAAALLERAVRFAAPNAGLFINLGEALRRVDRKPEAVTAFRRASQIDPRFAEAHYNLGLTLDQLGERHWMGVPIITLAGETVASRSGASLAHNLNLPELVARTPDSTWNGRPSWCATCESWASCVQGFAGACSAQP